MQNLLPELNLETCIGIYFDTSADSQTYAQAFDEHAVVIDEKTAYSGISQILQWRTSTQETYQYTSRPISASKEHDKTVVESVVEGNFPGSPITLKYAFHVREGKITKLEIVG